MIKPKVGRGIAAFSSLLLAVSITACVIMESYRTSIDENLHTTSWGIVTDEVSDDDWNFESQFKSASEAFNGYKEFALKEGDEAFALLKNTNDSLPLSSGSTSKPKVSLFGIRSYAPVYGNSMGSVADMNTIIANTNEKGDASLIFDDYFDINESLHDTYDSFFQTIYDTSGYGGSGFGASAPQYTVATYTDRVTELSPDELAAINPDYADDFAEYDDAAIVVLGRPGGESKNYYAGEEGFADTEGATLASTLTDPAGSQANAIDPDELETDTGNIFGISKEEWEILELAKENFDNVIVLVNSTNVLEIQGLVEDEDIDSILWIGYPGSYGLNGVCKILTGEVNPSAHLGDTYVTNGAVAPSMQSAGNIPWENADDFSADANVNSYLVEAEGIYSGYRYYETRYYDSITDSTGETEATTAKAGTYTVKEEGAFDGIANTYYPATTDGTWNYADEVVYPFGYGASYTEFSYEFVSDPVISEDNKTMTAQVRVTNVGDTAGKAVIQIYGHSPYTDYDREYGVEKSAVQLLDFEKTPTLEPGSAYTITMEIDLANLASYDYTEAETYIMDNTDGYYVTIGTDAHDAVNNILQAEGYDGLYDADENPVSKDTEELEAVIYDFAWNVGDGEVDSTTFSTSDNGTEITNRLSEGDYAMDSNAFSDDGIEEVTYLTRSSWNSTFPETYEGWSLTGRMAVLAANDFISLSTTDDTSEYVWGADNGLTIYDMKGADYDDERWSDLIDQVTIDEFLNYSAQSFHNLEDIESIQLLQYNTDDGPGGSDSHQLQEGTYHGTTFEDADEYDGFGTRVTPSQENLGYSWNKELAFENGQIILGETSLIFQLPIMIGPGMNIHRNGYNGRGGEYYSEDPILSGYIGSNTVQGAQSKGCLINIKHAAFNDQEINRSGVAVFMNEQKARELELRNLQQAFEGKGRPASFDSEANGELNSSVISEYGITADVMADTFGPDHLAMGVMTSYNRIGIVAPSANRGVMVDIMRGEWGFKGYNVTDFTGVANKAAPKESLLSYTTNFCGIGSPSVSYWDEASMINDADMCAAIKQNLHYALYAIANSNALNGLNTTSHRQEFVTWWRGLYIACITVSSALLVAGVVLYLVPEILQSRKNKKEVN